jgi:hypothetical protein
MMQVSEPFVGTPVVAPSAPLASDWILVAMGSKLESAKGSPVA